MNSRSTVDLKVRAAQLSRTANELVDNIDLLTLDSLQYLLMVIESELEYRLEGNEDE